MKTRFGVGAVFVALFLLGAAGCGSEEPLSEADKNLFLRAADLASYGYQYKNADSYETFSKTRQFDGSYQLTYEFQTPDGERRPLFIYATVSVARNASDAALAEGAEKIGMLIGLRANGVEEREVRLPPADERSRLRVLVKGGKPIGNVFTARDGRKTYMLVLSGVYFEDAEDWNKLVEPKLQQLAGYSPA
jgi:hypothetical protein